MQLLLQRSEGGLQAVDLGGGTLGDGHGGSLGGFLRGRLHLGDATVEGFVAGADVITLEINLLGELGPEAGRLGLALGLAPAVLQHRDHHDQRGGEDGDHDQEGVQAVALIRHHDQDRQHRDQVGGDQEPFFFEQFLDFAVHIRGTG